MKIALLRSITFSIYGSVIQILSCFMILYSIAFRIFGIIYPSLSNVHKYRYVSSVSCREEVCGSMLAVEWLGMTLCCYTSWLTAMLANYRQQDPTVMMAGRYELFKMHGFQQQTAAWQSPNTELECTFSMALFTSSQRLGLEEGKKLLVNNLMSMRIVWYSINNHSLLNCCLL